MRHCKKFKYYPIIALIVLAICPKVQTKTESSGKDVNFDFLKQSNFLVGIFNNAIQSAINSDCVDEMERILDGVQRKDMWAIKLIDAFGNVPSSFSWGNNFWYSPTMACDTLNHPLEMSPSSNYDRFTDPFFMNTTSPVDLQFRMIYANFTSPYQFELRLAIAQVLHIGLCVPRSCSGNEVTQFTTDFFRSSSLQLQNLYNITITTIGTKVPDFNWSILMIPSVLIFGVVIISLLILAITAAIKSRTYKSSGEKTTGKYEMDNFGKFVSCFDVSSNLKLLYTTNTSPEYLNCVTGLRSITCFWVITLHIVWHPMFTFDNSLKLVIAMDQAISQVFYQAFFYVDAFFVISAFLLTFNFLKSKKRIDEIQTNSLSQNTNLYSKMVAHRYMRLAPVFMLTTLLSDIVYSVLDLGTPFYINPTNDLYCKETWWYNIFFLNNIQTMDTMCVSWGWYLACEMQYFLIFLLILFVYSKHQKFGKFLYISVAILSLTISYYSFYSNGITFQFDVLYNTSGNLYSKPWTRMNSYIGGIFMGWLMSEMSSKNIKLNNFYAKRYWLTCGAIFICSICITYFKDTPVWMVALFQTLGRLILGIFIGSMIIVSQFGFGGYWHRFLSSEFFINFNKLTFTMYMFAPIVITFLFGIQRNSTHFDQIGLVMDGIGVILVSYMASVLAVVFVEFPFVKISEQFIK